MSQAVELPEIVWAALQQAAKARGVTPAGWIAAQLPAFADANGSSSSVENHGTDDQDPPTYTSVPLERVGGVQVAFVTGKERQPLPYPVEDCAE